MIESARKIFNQQFSEKKYADFLTDLDREFNYKITFRVAESPVFVGKEFKSKLFKAADEIIDFIALPDFKQKMKGALPSGLNVPNEDAHTMFLALDFAVCSEQDEIVPRLIEMQGFPSLFGYQDFLGNKFRQHYQMPANLEFHFGLSSDEYWARLRKAIVKDYNPENVILLEIDPMKQNTTIDFLVTKQHLGIEPVHIGDVIVRNKKLYYKRSGVETPIHRIYNRVIFDELLGKKDLKTNFHLTEDVDVEWAGHPNWFFYISKYTMPFLKNSSGVPECKFLNEYSSLPKDLEEYVLKPLFSFSGSGVIFNVTEKDILDIPLSERKNFLLQRKVHYQPIVQAPDGLVKTEIRLLFLWNDQASRPQLITNLARLSRGEMIGVKFNKDKTWVGGSVCFFES
jgi:hypothetical protein